MPHTLTGVTCVYCGAKFKVLVVRPLLFCGRHCEKLHQGEVLGRSLANIDFQAESVTLLNLDEVEGLEIGNG